MDCSHYKPLADIWNAEEDIEDLFRLEQALHEMAHLLLCQGHWRSFICDSMVVDNIINDTYRTQYQQDLHELRTSLVTAWAMQELGLSDVPEDIEDYCFESSEANILSDVVRETSREHYEKMKGHKVNRQRAHELVKFARFLNESERERVEDGA